MLVERWGEEGEELYPLRSEVATSSSSGIPVSEVVTSVVNKGLV